MGMVQCKILDQYLISGIVSTRSIRRFKRYQILKTFNQNLKRKISNSVILTSRLVRGWRWCSIKFEISTIYQAKYQQDPAKASEDIDFYKL